MALDLLKEKGTPLDQQGFTWRELAGVPISKLNDDAFTRVRVILMNGIEQEAVRFSHAMARQDLQLRVPLAQIRRVEHHQQTLVNWLLSADHSPLETTIGYEQTAIEVTADLAMHEPDEYLAQAYRFGLLEDFDHLYRFTALMDRLVGIDANNILQSYTDIRPGRPTAVEHRAAEDDVRDHYQKTKAAPLTKLNALTLVAAENQVRDYYMNIGPQFADPVARELYAEIASIEEQHTTHYESLTDPTETMLEKWLLHEATEVWNYWSCAQQESNPRIRAIWERFCDYELGHLRAVGELMKTHEARDPAELLPATLPDAIAFESHRQFVRDTLANEVNLRAVGTQFVPDPKSESARTLEYRSRMNRDGVPSEIVTSGYVWIPGTELLEAGLELYKTTQEERRIH